MDDALSAQVKPNNAMLEMKMPVAEQSSKHHDEKLNDYLEDRWQSITFAATEVQMCTNYAVAVVANEGREFHLTPLKRIMQMRPTFAHIEAIAAKTSQKIASKEDGQGTTDVARPVRSNTLSSSSCFECVDSPTSCF